MTEGMLVAIILGFGSLLSSSSAFTTTEFLKDSVKGTWELAPKTSATIFFCTKDPHLVLKNLSGLDLPVRLVEPNQWADALGSINAASPQGLHTIVVDMQCAKAGQLLQEASKLPIMKSPFRWMVLNITDEQQPEKSCQDLAAEISADGSALAHGRNADADMVLVCRGMSSLILVDLWGHMGPTTLGKWSNVETRFQGGRRPPAVRRLAVGLNGHVFRTAFVISHNDSYKHLTDGVDKVHDYLTKLNYEVTFIVADMLKASIHPLFTQHWGHYINGTWDGLVGLMARGEAEIGGTPSTISHDLLEVQTFLNYLTPGTACFIFREPPMSYIYNLFTRPFPPSLWIAIVGLLLLGAIQLYAVFRLEETGVLKKIETSQSTEAGKVHVSWSDVVLLTFGAVCQQGSAIEVRGVTGRIVTLFLFLGILFLYTSYTASIVALLQSTTSNIEHFKDFLDSTIELGAHDTSRNRYYLSTNNDTYRRRVFEEKITKYGKRDGFLSLEEGMNNVLTKYYAFFATRAEMYQAISDTFLENDKCGLREVDHNFLGVSNPMMTISRWSTYAEIIRIALRKIRERGIRHRQLQKYMAFKPVCANQGGNFQSVALTDCYGAFVVLIGGWGFSLFLLITEIFVSHRIAYRKL